jgi:peptide/nickel transport system substrate-binding protein
MRSIQSLARTRKLAPIALAAVLIMTLAACGETPSPSAAASGAPGTSVAPAESSEPGEAGRADTVIVKAFRAPEAEIGNPYVASSDALISDGVHQLVFEPLFYANYYTGELEPWLATDYAYNDDFTVITINLREGVTWADGEPFTADDVVFTMEQILAAEEPYRAANIVANVASAEAINESTVEITLNAPNPRFVDTDLSMYIYTSNFIPLPQHVFEGEDFATFAYFDLEQGWPMGTGPYSVDSIGPDRSLLVRNEEWWAAETGVAELPAPRQVIFSLQGPEDSLISELASNDVDWAGHYGLTPAGAQTALDQNAALQTFQTLDPCPWSLTVNTQAAPWDDPEMRWALNYAIDKAQFSSLFNQPDDPTPARTTFPEFSALASWLDENGALFEDYDTTTYDIARTAEILESKGYTQDGGLWVDGNGEPLTVRLSIFNAAALGAVWTTAEQLLIQNLTDAGFTVESAPGDFGVVVDARTNLDFDIQSWFECGSVTDPWSTLARYAGETGSDNPPQWSNDEYNDLVAEIGSLGTDDPAVPELAAEALEIFLAELPVIPMAQRPEPLVMSTEHWTNWPTNENPYTMATSWTMQFHQVITQLEPAE